MLESIWIVWKDWEFGQKKMPSCWSTLLAWRVIKRAETSSSPCDGGKAFVRKEERNWAKNYKNRS